MKNNFFAARRDIVEVDLLRIDLQRWVYEIAGQRCHGTTHQKPLDIFEVIEQSTLLPLPLERFVPVIWKAARVHTDTHVCFAKALYSVPWRFVGKSVWVRAHNKTIAIYADETRIATHDRIYAGKRSTIEQHLPEHRRDLRERSQSYWVERADKIGPKTGSYVRDVFASDDVLYQLRAVQSIVTHLETFPPSRAEATCERASFYGNYKYKGIKNILKKALDYQPLPNAVMPVSAALEKPRFARDVHELLQLPLEKINAPN